MEGIATFDVYVENLPITCTCEMLLEEFSGAGDIVDARISPYEKSWRYTFGFLSFKSITEAEKAVAHGSQASLGGRKLTAELSKKTARAVLLSTQTNKSKQKSADFVGKREKSTKKEKSVVTSHFVRKYEASEKQEEAITRELIRGLSNLRYDSWLRERLGLQEAVDLKQFYNYATGVLSSLVNVPEGVCTNPEVQGGDEITYHELMEELNSEGPLPHSDETHDEDHLDRMLASFWCCNGRHPFLSPEVNVERRIPHQDVTDFRTGYPKNQSTPLHHHPISNLGPTSTIPDSRNETLPTLSKVNSSEVSHEKVARAVLREPVLEERVIHGIEGNSQDRNRTRLFSGNSDDASCRCNEVKGRATSDEGTSLWNSTGPEVMLKELKAANILKRQIKAQNGDDRGSRLGRLHEAYEEAVKKFEARKSERLARFKKAMTSEQMLEEDITKGLKSLKDDNILDELSMEIQESLRLGSLES